MKLRFISLAIAAVLAFAAASFNVPAHAQTIQLTIIGSSAQYYEAAQADYAAKGCFYIDNNKDTVISDTRGTAPNNVALTDHAAFWVAWSAGTGTCAAPAGTYDIDFYMNTDSVVGTRCFMASPSCLVTVALQGTDSAFNCGTTPTNVPCTPLPVGPSPTPNFTTILTSIPINTAATDIRPEDGMFATLRALTPCGTAIVSGSQYLGIGDQTTDANQGYPIGGTTSAFGGFTGLGSSFNVGNFAIYGNDPASGSSIANGTGNNWTVIQVGAAPELVIVNASDGSGLGSIAISNINRATLAGFVDGTFGAVEDIIPQAYSGVNEVPVNTVLREYLSGTYNTFEYAIPNDLENQSSQEIGLAAADSATGWPIDYCSNASGSADPTLTVTNSNVSGPVWGLGASLTADESAPYNPLGVSEAHTNVTSTRSREIGTGNMVKAILGTEDGLGYAFWSESNFSSATPTTIKYLTVDGVDPIEEVWQDGEVPTPTNNLESNVSFSHVKDGSYPIWSILRMITSTTNTSGGDNPCNIASGGALQTGGTACSSLVTTLTTDEQKYVTPDFPDFVLKDQLSVVRSHFSPPGITYRSYLGGTHLNAPSNGDAGAVESGGDVGGMVYSFQADNDYAVEASNTTGNVGHRQ